MNKGFKERMKKLTNKTENFISELISIIENLEQEKELLNKKVSDMENINNFNKDIITKLKEENNEFKKKCEDLEEENELIKLEVDVLNLDLEERDGLINYLKNELELLTNSKVIETIPDDYLSKLNVKNESNLNDSNLETIIGENPKFLTLIKEAIIDKNEYKADEILIDNIDEIATDKEVLTEEDKVLLSYLAFNNSLLKTLIEKNEQIKSFVSGNSKEAFALDLLIKEQNAGFYIAFDECFQSYYNKEKRLFSNINKDIKSYLERLCNENSYKYVLDYAILQNGSEKGYSKYKAFVKVKGKYCLVYVLNDKENINYVKLDLLRFILKNDIKCYKEYHVLKERFSILTIDPFVEKMSNNIIDYKKSFKNFIHKLKGNASLLSLKARNDIALISMFLELFDTLKKGSKCIEDLYNKKDIEFEFIEVINEGRKSNEKKALVFEYFNKNKEKLLFSDTILKKLNLIFNFELKEFVGLDKYNKIINLYNNDMDKHIIVDKIEALLDDSKEASKLTKSKKNSILFIGNIVGVNKFRMDRILKINSMEPSLELLAYRKLGRTSGGYKYLTSNRMKFTYLDERIRKKLLAELIELQREREILGNKFFNIRSIEQPKNQVELSKESPIKKLGYSTNLGDKERWNILSKKAIPTLGEKKVAYHLRMLINMNKHRKNRQNAVEKWEKDLNKILSKK